MAQQNRQQRVREKVKAHREAHLAHREEREQTERERFTKQPTGREARHQAHAAVNQEYNPTIRGIRGELKSSVAAQKQSNQWYNQLAAEQAAAAQSQLAGANSFASSLTQQLANANAQNATTLAKQEAANQAFAQTTGMTGATGQAAAAGANVTNAENVALNAPNLGAAYTQSALTNRLGLATRERGHEVGNEMRTARKAVRQDLQAAQKQKGQAYVSRLGELRESARKQELDRKAFELEGQTAAQKAQLEQQQLAEQQRQQGIENKQKNREIGNETRKTNVEQGESRREEGRKNVELENQTKERERKEREGGREKKGGRSPAEKNAHREEVKNGYVAGQNAVRAFNRAEGTTAKNYTPRQWNLLEEHLIAPKSEGGSELEPAIARRVIEILKKQSGWTSSADVNGASLGR